MLRGNISTTVHAEHVLVGLGDQYNETASDWREGMIEEQSFETEMSEYHYPVWFVSYMPVGEENDVKLKIIQQDEVLEELENYIPNKIEGRIFSSLDAVSFIDYNQDGNTDILILKTGVRVSRRYVMSARESGQNSLCMS